jgi:hypothetical protein
MLTQEQLKEILHYDPETGIFRWRVSTAHRVKPWDVAGTKTDTGYILIGHKNISLKAHRLAWLYMTGEWPKHQIDHKDGSPSNNSWQNLRQATHKQNLENQPLRQDNTSGFRGVSWDKKKKKWEANLGHYRKKIFIGYFDTAEEAAQAAAAKRAELFTHDTGRDQNSTFG